MPFAVPATGICQHRGRAPIQSEAALAVKSPGKVRRPRPMEWIVAFVRSAAVMKDGEEAHRMGINLELLRDRRSVGKHPRPVGYAMQAIDTQAKPRARLARDGAQDSRTSCGRDAELH